LGYYRLYSTIAARKHNRKHSILKARILARLGWPLLVTLIGLPLLFWILAEPLGDRFSTTYLTFSSLGRIAGISAMVLFCLNVILTVRLKWVEDIFGGLNKMYYAHHVIGGISLIVLLAHPLLLALRALTVSKRDAALQLIPFANNLMTTIGILSLWLFIALMILTLYIKLPYKTWLLTHKFLGVVLIGIAVHVLLGSNDIRSSVPLKFYSIAILGAAIISFVARTILPNITARRYDYQLNSSTPLAPNIVELNLQPLGKRLRPKAGQFVFMAFGGGGFTHEWHPFTIADYLPDGSFTVIVKALGEYTSALIQVAPNLVGYTVGVEGTYGRFTFESFIRKRQVWIGGGIGITPFLSMAQQIPAGYQVDLYYCTHSNSEIVEWSALVESVERNDGRLRLIPFVSEKNGQVTADRITQISGDVSQADILICGPTPMMHGLCDQFVKSGLKRNQLHTEEFAMS